VKARKSWHKRNTLKHLSMQQRVADWDFTFPPTPAGGLPKEIFSEHKAMHLNGTRLSLDHYGPAHTDGDISVHFEDADIMHVADTYWNGIYPFIDYSTGGNIQGMMIATNRNIEKTTRDTIIIPGHGYPVSNRMELIEYRDMLVAITDHVSWLKASGHSVNETIAMKPTAQYDAKWGQYVISPDFFTRLVYEAA